MRYTGLGETVYDFADAEKFLVDRYFRNKPLVELRLRGFKYSDENAQASASLNTKVRGKHLVVIGLSYSPPYNPPHNKRRLDHQTEPEVSLNNVEWTLTNEIQRGAPK